MKRFVCFLFLALSLFPRLSEAHLTCEEVFLSGRQVMNQRMLNAYPGLSEIVREPEDFIKQIKGRFAQRKKTHPGQDPYAFEYGDIQNTKDTLTYMHTSLLERKAEFAQMRAELQKRIESRNLLHVAMRRWNAKKLDEVKIAQRMLTDLIGEINGVRQNGDSITYRQMIEVSHYFVRLASHFDDPKLGWWMRLLIKADRSVNGFEIIPMEKEYDLYKKRQYTMFQKPSPGKNFGSSEKPFVEALFPDDMQIVIVPSSAEFARDIFMRLMPYEIHFLGITNVPILADGFNRPAADFEVHDARHESAKHALKKLYIEEHNLSGETLGKVKMQMEQWNLELETAISKIQEKDLREAVDLFAFNWHHDRGYPIAPSAFLFSKRHIVMNLLYIQMKIGGQGVPYGRPLYNHLRADKWLKDFWSPRLAQEEALVRSVQSEVNRARVDADLVIAQSSNEKSTLELSSGLEINGNLDRIERDTNGKVYYISFRGETTLSLNGKVISGQGAKRHKTGFSTPVGRIVTPQGPRYLSTLGNWDKLKTAGIEKNKHTILKYESGVVVEGLVRDIVVNKQGKLLVMTLEEAKATRSGALLYSPSRSSFELGVGEHIEDVRP